MNLPKIDIILPVYNGEAFIASSIESVLNQTYENWQLIIVNDGSIDETGVILKGFHEKDSRIRVLNQANQGIVQSLNRALKLCSADYISFLDFDDLWENQKLDIQLRFLIENPDINCVFTHMQEFNDDHRNTKFGARSRNMKGWARSGFMGRSFLFEAYGLFDPNHLTGEFVEWMSRLLRSNEAIHTLPDVLVRRRVHSSNYSQTMDRKAFLAILKDHIEANKRS